MPRLESECGVLEMWKFIILFQAVLLSNGDAQKPINDQKLHEGIEISDLADTVETYQSGFTYRLPNNTRPESYLITMGFENFHENDMSFTGRVRITIKVLENNTNQITMHSAVTINSVELTLVTSTTDETLDETHEVDGEREFLIITTTRNLSEGSRVHIDISYDRDISTSFAGVYRGSYLNDQNEERCE